jgi:hypothetical protein
MRVPMKPFSELTGREKAIELLRWICVPATAVLAIVAVRVIAGFLMPPALAQPPGSPAIPASDFNRFILPWIFGLLMALAFVITGATTAPRRRVATAVVLVVLWTLYSLQIHVLVHLGRGVPHYTHFVVAAVAAACGAVYIVYSEKSKDSRGG